MSTLQIVRIVSVLTGAAVLYTMTQTLGYQFYIGLPVAIVAYTIVLVALGLAFKAEPPKSRSSASTTDAARPCLRRAGVRKARHDTDEMPSADADTPPDRLSVDPRSPWFNAEVLQRDVGIRFKGVEKTMSRNIASARAGSACRRQPPRTATDGR